MGIKSLFKNKIFLVYTVRQTLSIFENPNNFISKRNNTCG